MTPDSTAAVTWMATTWTFLTAATRKFKTDEKLIINPLTFFTKMWKT